MIYKTRLELINILEENGFVEKETEERIWEKTNLCKERMEIIADVSFDGYYLQSSLYFKYYPYSEEYKIETKVSKDLYIYNVPEEKIEDLLIAIEDCVSAIKYVMENNNFFFSRFDRYENYVLVSCERCNGFLDKEIRLSLDKTSSKFLEEIKNHRCY